MCRNIRVLHNFAPPTSPDEIRAAATQYVRKVGGITKLAAADEEAFNRAVHEISATTTRLLLGLTARGKVRTREDEAAKGRLRWQRREARIATK